MDYTIKQNDNLSTIAKNNNTDVATLQKLNNIKNPDLIQTGGTLKLPTVSNPVISTSNVINSQALAPVPTVNIPTPAPVITPVVPQIPVNNIASEYLKSQDLTQNEKSAQTGQDSIVTKMLENIAGLSGESAYRTEKLNNSNLNTLKQDLQSINSQILTKQAEINKSDVELIANMRAEERRDTLLPFAQMGQAKLSGDAQILRALKTSEIGVLNALALGRQGDISLAKETIQEAVDSRYAPYREQNAIYKAQLEAIQPLLTSAEKKQATAQQFKLNQAMKEIDKVSELQTKVLQNAFSMEAPQSVINAISKGQSIEEITKAGQGYLKSKADILDERLKNLQIRKLGADIDKTISETTGTGKLSADEKKTLTATNSLVSLLGQYKTAITGLNYFTANTPENRTKIGSLKGQITAEYKQAKQLGTLDNGVQALVDKIIPDPGSLSISSLDNAAQVKAIDDFTKTFDKTTGTGGNVTDSYFNQSMKVLTEIEKPSASGFIADYNSRQKKK